MTRINVACRSHFGMRRNARYAAWFSLSMILSPLAAADRESTTTARLRLIETTDLHANMESFDYYRNVPTLDSGLARAATLIRRERSEARNSLLIDNGDLVQGSPLGEWYRRERNPKTDLH